MPADEAASVTNSIVRQDPIRTVEYDPTYGEYQ